MSDSLHLLKTKRFLPLFITQFFGAFNDNAFKNAFLIWFTFDAASRLHLDPELMVTFAAGLFILPFFLFSATAGQYADRYEKSKLSQYIKLVEIILMLLSALAFYAESITALLVLLFCMGAQSTFFGPIKYSLLPEHLKEEELVAGNGLIEGGTFLAILLGTLFGGLIIRTEHGLIWLSACVVACAITGYLASRLIPKAPIGDANLTINRNIATETIRIVGFAKREKTVWLAILGISWFWIIGATFLTQFPVYTQKVIHGDEHVVTLFLTLFSVGIGVGSVWCNKLLKSKIDGKMVPYGAASISLAILVFIIGSYGYQPISAEVSVSEFISGGSYNLLIIVGLLGLAIASGIYIVPLYTIMQHRSPEQYIARIIAANNVLNAFFMVLSSLVVMALFTATLDVIEIFALLAFLNLPIIWLSHRFYKKGNIHD